MNRLSLSIQIEKTTSYVFEDINFSLVLTPRVGGDLPMWDTTQVDFEVLKLMEIGEQLEEDSDRRVLSGNFDQRDEKYVPLYAPSPEDGVDGIHERIPSITPEVEYVFREAGDIYSLSISLRNNILNPDELVSLPFGIYRLKVRYYLSFDEGSERFEDAEVDFVLTAQDKIVETIDYWASIIANSASLEDDYIDAVEAIEAFTSQFYDVHSNSTLEVRQKGAEEYSLWARHRGVFKSLIKEPDDMSEILEPPKPLKRYPLELFDYGDSNQSVDIPSINLAGKVKTFLSGFDSIVISNSRIAASQVTATRVGYDKWNATVPLAFGKNKLSLVARDLEGLESTTIIMVSRQE